MNKEQDKMNRSELSKLIEQSLLKDIDLSEEEYKKKCNSKDNKP